MLDLVVLLCAGLSMQEATASNFPDAFPATRGPKPRILAGLPGTWTGLGQPSLRGSSAVQSPIGRPVTKAPIEIDTTLVLVSNQERIFFENFSYYLQREFFALRGPKSSVLSFLSRKNTGNGPV